MAGVLLGGVASVALRQAVSSLLFDVTVAEPSVAIAIALFGLVGLTACYIPGARVTRLDPVQALRQG